MVTGFVLGKGDDELVVVVDEPWEGAGAAVAHADAPLGPAARGPVLLQSHQLPGGPGTHWVIAVGRVHPTYTRYIQYTLQIAYRYPVHTV